MFLNCTEVLMKNSLINVLLKLFQFKVKADLLLSHLSPLVNQGSLRWDNLWTSSSKKKWGHHRRITMADIWIWLHAVPCMFQLNALIAYVISIRMQLSAIFPSVRTPKPSQKQYNRKQLARNNKTLLKLIFTNKELLCHLPNERPWQQHPEHNLQISTIPH